MVDDFDAWYVETRASLVPALAAWCGNDGLAADALDEAFVRAVERWDRVRTLASPAGWVWHTAMNVVRRRTRRHQLEQRLLRRRAAASDGHVAGPSGGDVDLRRALLTLTERQRTAIVLFYVGVAVGTVAATLHQARHRLAGQLGAPIEDDAADAALQIHGEMP